MSNLDPDVSTLLPTACLNCEADNSFLRVIKTTFMLGGEESPNPVVICSDCGAIMVRIGGIVGEFGWALHKPTGIPKME